MTVLLSYVPSMEGRGALAFGFAEARMRETDLRVIASDQRDIDDGMDSDLTAARLAGEAPDVKCSVADIVPGLSHADRLIDASFEDDVDLLVVGIKRRSPVGKLLTGSAMQRVLLEAHCPVVAVKPPVRAAI